MKGLLSWQAAIVDVDFSVQCLKLRILNNLLILLSFNIVE
ncbi:MAG: hypothetical protein OFPI_41590 [Osedax symbiont Rs2]|nr:MAG: hypothetical protein OFPI_41590 [Osedax symbiont Rs2]